MHTLVAEPAEQTKRLNEITETLRKVSAASEAEAREQAVNEFLDSILARQAHLKQTTEALQALEDDIRQVLWFTDLSDAILQTMQGLIAAMNRLHNSLVKGYVLTSRYFAKHKIGKAGLTAFREATDNFKELADDLSERFFALPQDPEFQALMGELSDLE